MLREYMTRELDRLGVDVRLNSPLDAEDIGREQPWAVIVATGSEAVRPKLTEIQGMRVATGRDVLEASEPHQGRVIVAGGGCAGAQAAEYLATCGHSVTILEAASDIALDAPSDERALLLGRLRRHGVQMLVNARLVDLALGNVVVQLPHETRMVPADMVVLCLGAKPVNPLGAALEFAGLRGYVVGDASRPRKVTEAIAEGALAVIALLNGAREPVSVERRSSRRGAPLLETVQL